MSALAMNGAGVIHDFEIALSGATSEDVDEALGPGRFGMAEETGPSAQRNRRQRHRNADWDWVRRLRAYLADVKPAHAERSLLVAAQRLGVPVTVHVALGTDIVHMHPDASGAAIGDASLRDFRYFVSSVARLSGGVYSELRFSGRTAGSVSEGCCAGKKSGCVTRRPDDGEHRFRAAVSAANERGVQASGGNERGWNQSRRASRDTDSVDCRRCD